MPYSSSRRDRLRADMLGEIKGCARLLLRAGGTPAVSLRAIAREIGVTPAALYRYYPNLRALIDALREDVLGELVTRIELVRDQRPDDGAEIRMAEMARSFRQWALDNPAEFWLTLGPEPAGAPDNREAGPAGRAGLPVVRFPRLVAVFLDEFTRLRRPAGAQATTAILGFASAWTRLYGLVAMEASGRAPWPRAVAEALFEAELAGLGRPLGAAG